MKHILRVVAHWGLRVRIYVSMSGFMLVLLFALTGLTLNHEDFGLGQPQTAASTITLPPSVLENPNGFDSGRSWPWLIDLTAVFLTISSITGMVTLLSLRARRRSGFIVGGLSAAVILAIYWIWVPR